MGLSIRLETRQTQTLGLTPQLLQSIRLLQFDQSELADFLRRESERNPFLALKERQGGVRPPSVGDGLFDPVALSPVSLAAHALSEIDDNLTCPQDRALARALLLDLDEAGYLRVDVEESAMRLGVAPIRVAAVLDRLRGSAEPAGLFAGDLSQCLSLQLERRGQLSPVLVLLLSRLDLVARADLGALRRLTGQDDAAIAGALALIRRLDPKPGRPFGDPGVPVSEPDVLVTPAGRDGRWRVALNGRAAPRLSIDEDYVRTVGEAVLGADERAFLAECRRSAGWLIKALDQRARSVLAVAAHIVDVQQGFLTNGPDALAPLTLAAVARAVSLHESTVSRVVANKTIQTPRGLFELKFFFSAGLAAAGGTAAHSATGVRERIRRLVAQESPSAVLSDEDIVARLQADGICVARRTVAKYREALGIASSARRRREHGLRLVAS